MPTIIRVVVGVLGSLAAVILGYRIFRQHVVTAALIVGVLWGLRLVWKRRRNSTWREKKFLGGEALLNRLQQNLSLIEAWKKKTLKVIESLKELPEQDDSNESSPMDRGNLISEKESYLDILEQLEKRVTEGRDLLKESLETFRALYSGNKPRKTPQPGSREEEIREVIRDLERKLTYFSNDIEKLNMESPDTTEIRKLLKSNTFSP